MSAPDSERLQRVVWQAALDLGVHPKTADQLQRVVAHAAAGGSPDADGRTLPADHPLQRLRMAAEGLDATVKAIRLLESDLPAELIEGPLFASLSALVGHCEVGIAYLQSRVVPALASLDPVTDDDTPSARRRRGAQWN